MNWEGALVVTTSVMSVVGIGSLVGMIRAVKKWGSTEANHLRDISDLKTEITVIREIKTEIAAIKEIKAEVTAINHLLNNGGLVKELKTMQINCGSQMAAALTALDSHARLPGHGSLPERVASTEARINSLEDSRRTHHG